MRDEAEYPVYPGDWPEDFLTFKHENGYYQNVCIDCKHTFMGHKRRTICKICAQPDWEKIAVIERPNNLPAMFRGAWSEGEMVGYAQCMINKVRPLTAERDYYKELAESADAAIEFRKTEPPIMSKEFPRFVEDFRPIMQKYSELKSKQP